MLADEVEEYTDVEFGTGWYIRGDIALTTTGGLFNTDTSEPIPGTSILQVTTTDEESLLGGGVAVGYRLNDNFRVDLGLSRTQESLRRVPSRSQLELGSDMQYEWVDYHCTRQIERQKGILELCAQ